MEEATKKLYEEIRNCTRAVGLYIYDYLDPTKAIQHGDVAALSGGPQLRETSARLYQALSECTFKCTCHDCFFRLEDSSFEGASSQPSIVFSLLIVP